jgi:hypothetical protein
MSSQVEASIGTIEPLASIGSWLRAGEATANATHRRIAGMLAN